MKCQNCGNDEVNFHYSSSINGRVTETCLCSDCLAKAGYDMGRLFGANGIFGKFFPILNKYNGLSSVAIPAASIGNAMQFTAQPQQRTSTQTHTCMCENGCATGTVDKQTGNVDNEMRKRRELYQQMRIAADSEDYEKAAELRDQIKKLEA